MKQVAHIIEVTVNIVSGHFSGWLVVIMTSLVLIEVVSRYIFGAPLRIADELGAYMMVAMVFLGLGYTWKEKRHIAIEFVIDRFPPKVRIWLDLIILIIVAGFVPVMIYASYEVVISSFKTGITGYGGLLQLPLAWPKLTLLIGSIILIFPIISDLVKTVRAIGAPRLNSNEL